MMPEKGSGQQIQMAMMNPRLADFTYRTSIKGTAGYAMQQLINDPAKSWANKTIANLAAEEGACCTGNLARWRLPLLTTSYHTITGK